MRTGVDGPGVLIFGACVILGMGVRFGLERPNALVTRFWTQFTFLYSNVCHGMAVMRDEADNQWCTIIK